MEILSTGLLLIVIISQMVTFFYLNDVQTKLERVDKNLLNIGLKHEIWD